MNIFEKFGLSNTLLTAIKGLGIIKPTLIQEKSIPSIMRGEDVIGESATGSGKTLAFACAIVEQVIPKKGLQALILTPTRELAEQVKNALKQFAFHKNLKIITIYGGVSINPQIHGLEYADVVVGTPGRLLDHLQRRTINTSKIKILVLDEADRMLDMGFIDDVERIIRTCPTKRQTLFFSATISTRIKELANKYMKKPIKVLVRNQVDPSKLKQVYYDVEKNMKLSLLVHLLKKERSGLIMVFCNTRRTTEFVVRNLKANKISAIAIHGGLPQNKRARTIEMFNNAKVRVLVCTDVAARGLHIANVSHIYNYDIQKDPKDYIHRIGRTARAGKEGIAVNLLCNHDYDNFTRLLDNYSNFTIKKMDKIHVEKIVMVRSDNWRGNSRGNRRGDWRGNSNKRNNRRGNRRNDRRDNKRGRFRSDARKPFRSGPPRNERSRSRLPKGRGRKPFRKTNGEQFKSSGKRPFKGSNRGVSRNDRRSHAVKRKGSFSGKR